MSDDLVIQSHKGPYSVRFLGSVADAATAVTGYDVHVIVDARVADLYADALGPLLAGPSVLRIVATETNKALDRFPAYVAHLVGHGIRRDHRLIAIGGGIIQDITCFLAATLLRGVEWTFLPTTLLAQADSCIGSKSSINSGDAKNILGTFTPPTEILLTTRFLDTLDDRDVRSGVGEMLKVHAIDGPDAFDAIAADYDRLFSDRVVMVRYLRRSLEIKQRYIELDEFDRGHRNIFNLGHSFGHAIEAATDFAVPHGIAVTIGLDMANFVAERLGIGTAETRQRMRPVLAENARGYESVPVPLNRFLAAISKDKKNQGGDVTLILIGRDGRVFKDRYPKDEAFKNACADYFAQRVAAK